MTDTNKLLWELSPQKRALFELWQKERTQKRQSLLPIPPRPDPGSFTLSFAQQRLWFLSQYTPATPVYNVAAAYRLYGTLDIDRLQHAVSEIIRRHEILRATFLSAQGEPIQVIRPATQRALSVIDLQALPEPQRTADALHRVQEEATTPFDLTVGPLIRPTLLRLSPQEHIFQISMHHIVSDGGSMDVLFDELSRLYRMGAAEPLPDLAIQYSDYAHWQRVALAADTLQSQVNYWKKQLQNLPAPLNLPTDKPRPPVQSFRGEKKFLILAPELAGGVRTFAEQQGVTLFMLLLAIFQLLLHRETGQADIIVGSPVSGRTRSDLEPLIGFFSNILPLRVHFDDDPSVTEILKRVREATLDAQENQDVPFEKLLEELHLPRDPSYTPVFQAAFAFHAAVGGPSLPGLRYERLDLDTGTSKWDFTLEVLDEAEKLTCVFEYATNLFSGSTIDRFMGHFEALLQQIVSAPNRRASDFSLLTENEKEQVLLDWNNTAQTYPKRGSLAELFEAQVQQRPEALAVVYGQQEWTYAELNRRANQLAHWLKRRGVGPGVLVAVCLERSAEMVMALLAIVKAGGAYVPLDPVYPPERLTMMLVDAQAGAVIAQERTLSCLPSDWGEVVCLERDVRQIAAMPDQDPAAETCGKDLAYVMYTSGSTGIPKGIEIEQRAVSRLVLNTNYVHLGPDDHVAQASNTSFDAATFEIWGALLNGARLVGLEKLVLLSPHTLAERIREHGITTLFLTTALFHQLAQQRPGIFAGMRNLLFGGEAVDPRRVARVLQAGGPERLLHVYGPTETTTFATWHLVEEVGENAATVPIGQPIANTTAYVLDQKGEPLPVGVVGELYVGGDGVARGYLNQPEFTAERFVPDRFSGVAGSRLYRTGDLCRRRGDGAIEFVGRIDTQVKIRGFRIELTEISSILERHERIEQAVVLAREVHGDKRLVAYVVPRKGELPAVGELRRYLAEKLPEYMVPAEFMILEQLPLNANAKIDQQALLNYQTKAKEERHEAVIPHTGLPRQIADIWQELLAIEQVGLDDNFFDLGGHSLLLTKVQARLSELLRREIAVVDLFKYPTVRSLANYLGGEQRDSSRAPVIHANPAPRSREPIAIVAAAGRFPDANTLEEFWQNLRSGRESIRQFTHEELIANGVDPGLLADPNYVKAGTVLDGVDMFDAGYFGFSAREAEITDPQHRLFLECALEALEKAGCDPQTYDGSVGVFAGSTMSTYFLHNLNGKLTHGRNLTPLQLLLANDKDFLPTRLSYKLNLKGPSVNVQTACSTSLVAVHLACQSLLEGACDTALAGGVSIHFPQRVGYLYQPEGIASPDGHCRPFDAQARGTVSGAGVAIVVLKRLSDAQADGNDILAVIRGSAINNDGSEKIGYTAPSVHGQAEVIAAAQSAAGVKPETITYIEAHGTGTALGDPIEVAALTQAFGAAERPQYCALGSLKSNIGHLDAAAGVAGLIKVVLQLQQRELVPSLHFEEPNPKIDFENSPFYVNSRLQAWHTPEGVPRRAGVSSFGIGGTNAHLIVEEAPQQTRSGRSRDWQVITVSAKSKSALERRAQNLADYLSNHEINLADVTYTCQVGRTGYKYRRAIACRTRDEAARSLTAVGMGTPDGIVHTQPKVRFLFPGQGAQYVGMGNDLYNSEEVYRDEIDRCVELLRGSLSGDLLEALRAGKQQHEKFAEYLNQTSIAQPILFSVEWALAKLWESWGVCPDAMAGHSLGEYVAATLAGVMRVEDALRLVVERGRLMQGVPRGTMLSVPLGEEELPTVLLPELDVAALNGPHSSVVSGSMEAVAELELRLRELGIEGKRLQTSHAFHSAMMDPILSQFRRSIEQVELKVPRLRYLSNVSGTWIRAEEAIDPEYWVRHLRQTVRFGDNIKELLADDAVLLLEVGPGNTLGTLARRQAKNVAVLSSLPAPHGTSSDCETLAKTVAQLWVHGVKIEWAKYNAQNNRRISLPTYPFERQRYWVNAPSEPEAVSAGAGKRADIADWFYVPGWDRAPELSRIEVKHRLDSKRKWLFLLDKNGLGRKVAQILNQADQQVVLVAAGTGFRENEELFEIDITSPEDYGKLLGVLKRSNRLPSHIVHMFSLDRPQSVGEARRRGFDSVLYLVQALDRQCEGHALTINICTAGVFDVLGSEELNPESATLVGACTVFPQEYRNLQCRIVDVIPTAADSDGAQLATQIVSDCASGSQEMAVALRGRYRWVQTFRPVRIREAADISPLREQGVYLITGGLGGVGLALAQYLARSVHAHLVLVGRTSLPPRHDWKGWLATHGPDDKISRAIKAIEEIEREASAVLVCEADISDLEQTRRMLHQVHEKFGSIHGLIHAAGVAGGTLIARQRPELIDEVFASKIGGTRVLHELLHGEDLDFMVLCSSQRSVLGAPGRIDYCAANAYLNAYAQAANRPGQRKVMSILWDSWKEAGMGLVNGQIAEQTMSTGLTNQEGVEVFRRVLQAELPVVLISTEDFEYRRKLHQDLTVANVLETFEHQHLAQIAVHPRPMLQNEYAAPENRVQQKLAEIWQQLLGLEKVGIHDNFFEMGGDSVISLQVVSRCRQVGLDLTPKQMFEHQTIAELASVVVTGTRHPDQTVITGPVPLTPIQHWFFEQGFPEMQHFNQALLVAFQNTWSDAVIERALQHLIEHHDALRLRYQRSDRGWEGSIAREEAVSFRRENISLIPQGERPSYIEAVANEVQTGLNLFEGPLFRAVIFGSGARMPSWLLLVAHHFVVDLISWRILIEDLQTACEQLSAGQPVRLPSKTDSFQQWGQQLRMLTAQGAFDAELPHWTAEARQNVAVLPIDHPNSREGVTEATAAILSAELSGEETRALLCEVPESYGVHTQEALLSALAQSFARWSGVPKLLVDLEGIGRDDLGTEIDVSRTVGWFTNVYPLLLEVPEGNEPEAILRLIHSQLQRVPKRGIGYGALRYLSTEDIRRKLANFPEAEVCFLYQGNTSRSEVHTSRFRQLQGPVGKEHSPLTPLKYKFNLNCWIAADRLRVNWLYSERLYTRQTTEKLNTYFLDHLRLIITRSHATQTTHASGGIPEFKWASSDVIAITTAIERNLGKT